MNQVELLLRLSQNAQETGDDIAKRHHTEREEHVKNLQQLWDMIEMARRNVWTELSRFGALNENKQAENRGLEAMSPQQGRLPRAVAANQTQQTKETRQ